MKSPAVRLILPLLLLSTLLKAEETVYGTFMQSLKEFCLQVQDPDQRQEFELRLAQLQAALQDYRRAETERHQLICDFYRQYITSLPASVSLSSHDKTCYRFSDHSFLETENPVVFTPKDCFCHNVVSLPAGSSDTDFSISSNFGISEGNFFFHLHPDRIINGNRLILAFHRQNSPRAVTLASYPF